MIKIKKIGRWIDATALKCVKTMAQTAVGIIAACAMFEEIDWWMVLSACIVAGLVTLLTNIDTLPDIDNTNIFESDTEDEILTILENEEEDE